MKLTIGDLFKTLFLAATCWCLVGCFAPRLPDEDIDRALSLAVLAGDQPKRVRFVWQTPPIVRRSIDTYDVEIDEMGSGNWLPMQGLEGLSKSRTEAQVALPLHLVRWSTTRWRILGRGTNGDVVTESEPVVARDTRVSVDAIGYIKASNPTEGAAFGSSVAISTNGRVLAVGAYLESSDAIGINGFGNGLGSSFSGATYVYREVDGQWIEDAYVKASNREDNDSFGWNLDLSDDGSVLAASALSEEGTSRGVDGDMTDNGNSNVDGESVGAVYIFEHSNMGWTQAAYLKPSNSESDGQFLFARVSLSGDGSTLAVGAPGEGGGSAGVNGDEFLMGAEASGAVYVFGREGSTWQQTAYIKSALPDAGDRFGLRVRLSTDGQVLAVSAPREDGGGRGNDADPTSNDSSDAGAVYVFERTSGSWRQEAYLKPLSPNSEDLFGTALDLSDDGDVIVVGAPNEDGGVFEIDGDAEDNSREDSGAAYIFVRDAEGWSQRAYLKDSAGRVRDGFGNRVSVSSTGDIVVVAARGQDGNQPGVGGSSTNTDAEDSGSATIYERLGTSWLEINRIKASNPDAGDAFGVSIDVSGDGAAVVVGAFRESAASSGFGGDQQDNELSAAGAAYLY